MLDTPYHFATIRSTTAAFGRLFNNIKIQRYNSNGSLRQTIKVPIAYGPKRSWYTRVTQAPAVPDEAGHMVAVIVPRMSFQMISMNLDQTRVSNVTNRLTHKDPDLNRLLSNYQPMPFDYNFELGILVKNTDDGLRIIEQILPAFKPQVSITVNDLPELGLKRDVPVIFQDVSQEDTYEVNFQDNQVLVWTLSFLVKGWLYPAITDGNVIKKVNAYIYANADMTNRTETITTQVDPLSANEWDVDSNGVPTYNIETIIETDSNG